ncbi:hypothetical protein CCMSSC00406_0006379 [Pleurotus cornucopiae]|uniref:Uncharacterized protein n=1 Tax=Pleurotus cornucopiae TaxID=5321 RepID=A0ACB7IS08_PLECO|nr:hypothetical protein CCMSSC00406_0006379 [Pleurotus cornucopiae]
MRFVSALVVVCAAFKSVMAVEPGNNALHIGVSDSFEAAIRKEYGPVIFDSLAASGCDAWKCLGTVAKATPCLLGCVAMRNPLCVISCVAESDLCPCINCFPAVITDFLHKWGICDKELHAQLFSKVYLGLASDEENRKAQELGYSVSTFGA